MFILTFLGNGGVIFGFWPTYITRFIYFEFKTLKKNEVPRQKNNQRQEKVAKSEKTDEGS